MKNDRIASLRKNLDTSVHEVGPNRNIMESLKQFREETKQDFFDGAALPYAETRGQKMSLKD